MSVDDSLLKEMVREILRDLVAEPGVARTGSAEVVRVASQADLDRALARVGAADGVARDAVARGELHFEYVAAAAGPPADAPARPLADGTPRRVERGALTERIVNDAARSGSTIEIARGVVVTPLARDRARALGVSIHQDRQE
jgi:hypothetical protein